MSVLLGPVRRRMPFSILSTENSWHFHRKVGRPASFFEMLLCSRTSLLRQTPWLRHRDTIWTSQPVRLWNNALAFESLHLLSRHRRQVSTNNHNGMSIIQGLKDLVNGFVWWVANQALIYLRWLTNDKVPSNREKLKIAVYWGL